MITFKIGDKVRHKEVEAAGVGEVIEIVGGHVRVQYPTWYGKCLDNPDELELVDEPCPAQAAVEGSPLPEPFTHGDAIPAAAFSTAPIDVGSFKAPSCPSCGSTGDFHWSHCTVGIKAIDPATIEFTQSYEDDRLDAIAASTDIKAEIADEAKRIVSGARRSAYGKPEQNFERIAAMWTAYAKAKGWPVEFTAGDISPLMILMKIARIVESPDHYDSWVDAVGYSLTGAEVNKVRSSA